MTHSRGDEGPRESIDRLGELFSQPASPANQEPEPSRHYQYWKLRSSCVQLHIMHDYALHPIQSIEIPFTSWHIDSQCVNPVTSEWRQYVFINIVLPRERIAIGLEQVAIDGITVFATWANLRADMDAVQVTLRFEPTEFNETREVDILYAGLSVDAIVRSPTREPIAFRSRFPASCYGCRNFYGQVYNGNAFCCAMHPYGKETCEDFDREH